MKFFPIQKLTLLSIISLATLFAGVKFVLATDAPTTQPAVAATAVNTKCPVTGDPIDPKITVVYNGKTYAFCCMDCVNNFKKDPAKYAVAK